MEVSIIGFDAVSARLDIDADGGVDSGDDEDVTAGVVDPVAGVRPEPWGNASSNPSFVSSSLSASEASASELRLCDFLDKLSSESVDTFAFFEQIAESVSQSSHLAFFIVFFSNDTDTLTKKDSHALSLSPLFLVFIFFFCYKLVS